MTEEQNQGAAGKLKGVLGFGLVIISGAFALTMVMRFVGRFLVFLVVDRPEIGFGFLLSTFATTALGVYVAWQVAKKGIELSGGPGPEVVINEGVVIKEGASEGSADKEAASKEGDARTTAPPGAQDSAQGTMPEGKPAQND